MASTKYSAVVAKYFPEAFLNTETKKLMTKETPFKQQAKNQQAKKSLFETGNCSSPALDNPPTFSLKTQLKQYQKDTTPLKISCQ